MAGCEKCGLGAMSTTRASTTLSDGPAARLSHGARSDALHQEEEFSDRLLKRLATGQTPGLSPAPPQDQGRLRLPAHSASNFCTAASSASPRKPVSRSFPFLSMSHVAGMESIP